MKSNLGFFIRSSYSSLLLKGEKFQISFLGHVVNHIANASLNTGKVYPLGQFSESCNGLWME